jgi:hypothetical protein
MKTCCICNTEKENHCFIRGNAHPKCKACKDKLRKEYEKDYRKTNKSKILLDNKVYKQKRRTNDPSFRLASNCSRMINIALCGNKCNYSIWKFLPYTKDDLKQHLENKFDSKMSWGNYGSYWHLDHIIPQSLLPYHSMQDETFIKCWSLDNLQPLEAVTNIKKSNKVPYEIK